MSGRWDQLPPTTRLLAYVATAILVLAMAVGIGAVAALMVSGNATSSTGDKASSGESSRKGEQTKLAQHDQTKSETSQQQYSDAKKGQASPQDRRSNYVDEVGEIQARSVTTFSDSHEMFLRYDALTSGDVEKLRADQAALKGFTDQADALDAPRMYEEQRDVFRSAIDELHQAAQLSYVLAADPLSATQDDFEQYDHLVNEAAAGLQRSNEILGKDYKTIEEVKGVSASQ
jgi:hypothetical protein